jgi:acyl-CoA thioesterase I
MSSRTLSSADVSEAAKSAPAGPIVRYVALGDSYTIGTSVQRGRRWPDQLVARLRARDVPIELVDNLGVNGYTSDDVIRAELPRLAELDPDFITVLVGVNDVVQGDSDETYRKNIGRILDESVRRVGVDRIVAVSTPDYTVTPQGAAYGDPVTQSERIRDVNLILREESDTRGITFVDIHDISLEAAEDVSLVASDGLHPSAIQYARWTDRIEPVVRELLAARP